ncbi:MAG: aconitate hydratase, partial [Pseudomonadota bacterium]
IFSKAGNGICHQVHLERFAVPGKTLLGADSHTPTCGAVGMIAIGAGGLDVAIALGGGPFYLINPKVIQIYLRGQLRPWTSAKDVALTVLEIFTTHGNVGSVLEYGGEGIRNLSVPERATITNMGTECGVTTSIFPSDEKTLEFLKAQGREKDWAPLAADKGTQYDRVVEIDMSQIEPKLACPSSPGNVKKVRDMGRVKVDQVCIGSCTNASYRDIKMVSEILKDKKIHPDVSLGVSAGSRQVLQMVTRESALGAILASGARLHESVCGFCLGAGQSPQSDGISLRTSNRNFLGRSGTKSALVYLVSPETAAASALKGEITDPRDLDMAYPLIDMPETFVSDDSLFIWPSKDPEDIHLYRGPHMGSLPMNTPLPETIAGEVTIKVGDKVTTDHIVPSGSRMKYRSNIAKYAEFLFEVLDPSFHDRALRIRDEGRHNIIIGGYSYGQGSSREHAALCPMYLGVKAVIAKSIERIHRSNLINFGIVPFIFANEADYDWILQGDELAIHDIRRVLEKNGMVTVMNTTRNENFTVSIELSDREKEIIFAGGSLRYIRERTV